MLQTLDISNCQFCKIKSSKFEVSNLKVYNTRLQKYKNKQIPLSIFAW